MMARKLRPASERAAGHGPEAIIERTRALIVRERPPVIPSDNRKALAERGVPTPVAGAVPPKLFNRVVRIEGETDYEYFYVLTYLPDLQWCHVGPLEKRGVFAAGSTRGRPGRDRWQLVPEEMGGERDCGASRCHIMEATEVKQTKESADEVSSNPGPNPIPNPNPSPNPYPNPDPNPNQEEWDVIGLAAPPAPPTAAAPAAATPTEQGVELGSWLAAASQPPPSAAAPPKPAGVLAGIGLKAPPPACEGASSASSSQPPPPEAMDVV